MMVVRVLDSSKRPVSLLMASTKPLGSGLAASLATFAVGAIAVVAGIPETRNSHRAQKSPICGFGYGLYRGLFQFPQDFSQKLLGIDRSLD